MSAVRILVGTRKGAFILSHEMPDTPLPGAVRDGTEPLLVVGAIAGG